MIREELARMGREPVAERELALAKQYLIGSFPLRLDTSGKVADFLVAVEDRGLGLDYADRYKERIGRVTAADVQRVAAKYFTPAAFNLVIVGETQVNAFTAPVLALLSGRPVGGRRRVVHPRAPSSEPTRSGWAPESITRDSFDTEWRVANQSGETASRSSRPSIGSSSRLATRRSRTSA